MNALAQHPSFPFAALAILNLPDLDNVVSQSFYSDAKIDGKAITFRDATTVWIDDKAAGKRVVVRLTLETKKQGGKRVPLLNATPCLRVSHLDGYDPVGNMWGGNGHEEQYLEIGVTDAWVLHLQLEAIRASMKKQTPHWYQN